MMSAVTQALVRFGAIAADETPRYLIGLTHGDTIWLDAYRSDGTFFHAKVAEYASLREESRVYDEAFAVYGRFMAAPVGYTVVGQWDIFVTKGVEHRTLSTDPLHGSAGARAMLAEFREFFAQQARSTAMMPSPRHGELLDRMHRTFAGTAFEPLLERWSSSEGRRDLEALGGCRQHGDFAVNNLGMCDTRLVAYDWEDFGKVEIPGFDLCTLAVSLLGELAPDAPFTADSPGADRLRPLLEPACAALGMTTDAFWRRVPFYLLVFLHLKQSYAAAIRSRIERLLDPHCAAVVSVSARRATATDSSSQRTFGKELLHGSAWMVGMRWALRLTGLVSTAVLARLLVPADFGIVAMAAVFAGLLDTAAYTGVDLALIRAGRSTPARMNSAWTIQLIQAWIVALLLVASAPFAADFFREPRVTVVMLWMAAKAVIEGLQNIGIIEFRRDLNFAKEFRFNLYAKLLNLAIVIVAAFILRNYLALVIGLVSGSVITVLLSYLMHPYRPRLSLAEREGLWSFSNWLLLSRVGSFMCRKLDQFVVGGAVGSAALGNYHVATELATMPTDELVMPMRRALFPTLSLLQKQGTSFHEATLSTFGALAVVCCSLGFGLFATAREAVALVLGPHWQAAVPVVQWLAIYGAFAGLTSVLEVPMWVKGKGYVSAIQSWLEFFALIPLLVFAVRWNGIEGAAMSRAAVAAGVLPTMLFLLSRTCDIPFAELAKVVWRPLVAGATMTFCIIAVPIDYPALPALVLKIMIGAPVYAISLGLLWLLAGRPDGIERLVVDRGKRFLRRGPLETPGIAHRE